MVSIRDVAQLAQVSPATVSRVMNGTANVDTEKRERVLRAIEETGFVPNAVARSLFKKSAKIIGLIVPDIKNPFFTQLANVIERTAGEGGFRLLLCSSGDELEKEKATIQLLSSMNADGIIISTNNEELIQVIDECKIPVVITDRRIEKVMSSDYVHCDHYEGGRLAMEHLLECGCKNIVCMRAPQEISSARARYDGYADVCWEKNIKRQVIDCNYSFDEGLKQIDVLLEKYPEVDGIIACNDMVALAVYKGLHSKGILVPDEIQIIGFDDITWASLMTPALTTIAQPIEEIGRKVAELIIHKDEYEGKEKKEYIYKAKLMKRETTREKS